MDEPIVIPDELQIFEPPSFLESYIKRTEIWVKPSEGWQKGTQINFNLPVFESQVFITDEIEVHMTTKVVNSDGSRVDDATQRYAPVCGFGQLAFTPTIKIGDTYVWGDNCYNSYVDYLLLKLGQSKDAKEGYLRRSLGWYEDEPGKFDDMDLIPENPELASTYNRGFVDRYALFKGGKEVDTICKLNWPLTMIGKILPPNLKMNIILNKNLQNWVMQCQPIDKPTELKIVDIKLKCVVKTPQPEAMKEITRLLVAENKSAAYFFHRYQINGPFQLATNQSDFDMVVFNSADKPPLAALVFMVETLRAQGSYAKNALKFVNPEYTQIYMENESDCFPPQKYNFGKKFTKNPLTAQAIEPYNELFRILQQKAGLSCGLTYEEFIDGTTVIPFQIATSPVDPSYQQAKRSGDTRLSFKLQSPLTTETNLFVIGIYESELDIDFASVVDKTYKK